MGALNLLCVAEADDVPTFSVIVPVFEQWQRMPLLLQALREQSWTGTFETILIDNGSRDYAPPTSLPSRTCILHCDTPGSYAARNAGIAIARGRWLLFTDADCVPDADWLARMAEALAVHGDRCLLAGAVEVTAEGSGEPNSYQIYDMVKGIPQAHYVRRGYAATANLCVPKAVIDDVGAFDSSRYSGGDSDLCRRTNQHGYGLHYLPAAVVRHPARDSWSALVIKARRVKGGQLAAGSMRRRTLYFLRSFTPPLIAIWRFLKERQQPLRFRFIAIAVQMRIWTVDMHEALRLGVGLHPERR